MHTNLLEKLNDKKFPVSIIERHNDLQGPIFEKHVHNNEIQFFYFKEGKAMIRCGGKNYSVMPGDVILINSNEIHCNEKLSDIMEYFIIKINLDLVDLYNITACNEKYIEPIKENLILFHNRIENSRIKQAIKYMIYEHNILKNGYEFRLLSLMYDIIYELFESQIARALSEKDAKSIGKSRTRFQYVLEYIENNYEEQISLEYIAKIAEMSKGYFCIMFKQITGKSFTDYLNRLRIEKAIILLNKKERNITDIALEVGYDDVNYFCRVFKKYMKKSASSYRNSIQF